MQNLADEWLRINRAWPVALVKQFNLILKLINQTELTR